MSKKLRRILTVVLAAVLAGSLGMLAFQSWQYSRGEKSYAEAEELVQLPDLSAIPLPQPSDAQPPAQQTPPPESTPTPDDAPPVSDGGETAPEEEPEPVYVDPYAEALRAMDFQAIRAANSDVLGWIVIPNTVLSYPLVQGEDNDYYLNRTWRD